MSGKIDWVALHPMRAAGAGLTGPAGIDRFKRDVMPLGRDAERNHVKLSQYAQQADARRRGES